MFGTRVLVLGLLAAMLTGILTTGYFSWRTIQRDIGAQAQYKVDREAMDKLEADAALKLAEATAQRDAAERELNVFKHNQEIKDAQNRKTNTALAAKLATLSAAAGGRLRDPNAEVDCGRSGHPPTSPPTATADNRHDDGTETGGLLSVQLSDLLRERLREADEINNAYASCRADVFAVRKMCPAPTQEP